MEREPGRWRKPAVFFTPSIDAKGKCRHDRCRRCCSAECETNPGFVDSDSAEVASGGVVDQVPPVREGGPQPGLEISALAPSLFELASSVLASCVIAPEEPLQGVRARPRSLRLPRELGEPLPLPIMERLWRAKP